MARKNARRMPQVPRSSAEGVPLTNTGAPVATPRGGEIARPRPTIQVDFASEYSYVRGDLMRIFGVVSLLVILMVVLSFVIGG
jgi:hypothetical protein